MEVIVQDANNIVIEVDQGRQGRGISTVSLVTVGADYYLLFTFTDGSTEQVGPIAPIVTEVLFAEARNAEATTILKGQPVYLFQAQGNLATVKLAFNTSDATSAKTLGLAAENIAPGAQGLITCQGTLGGLNTSAYNEGDTLYLGATAGTLTNVKPQAPNHLVYIGVVERANAGAGQIYVRVQNGYELDEIHDVLIVNPVNGNTLIYDAATDLWKNAGITAGSGISVTNGPGSISVGNTGVLSFAGGTTGLTPATATTGAVSLAGTLNIANGGTGQTTANGALNALLPSQTSQSGKYLKTDGSNASWDQLDISTADITGTLPVVNGGTGVTTSTGTGSVVLSNSPALTTPNLGTPSAATLTNATGLPVATGISGLGAGVATFLATPSSANLAAAVTDETGTGALVFANSPAFTTPNLGTPSAATLTNATGLPLTTGVTGTLAAANGGTGQSSYTVGDLVYATGTTALSKLGIGTNGQILTSTGTAPQWSTLSGVAVTTFSAGTTGFTPSTATSGAVTLAGTLATTNGGTGLTSFTSGGVVYASSTSALTTGSALTFDGAKLIASGGNEAIRIASGAPYYSFYNAAQSTQFGYIQHTGTDLALVNVQNGAIPFYTNNTEQMRLTSTGLGIGTSSPASKLVVSNGASKNLEVQPGATIYVLAYDRAASDYLNLDVSGKLITFSTNTGAERMRLDSSGNLGIGTSSPAYKLVVSNSGAAGLELDGSGGSAGGALVQAYNRTTSAYMSLTTDALQQLFRIDGSEQMRLTSTGLGIGTSSPSQKLTVSGAGAFSRIGINANAIDTVSTAQSFVRFQSTGADFYVGTESGTGGVFFPGSTAYAAVLYNANATPMQFYTGGGLRATLDSSGNLGIGTSSPAAKFEVQAAVNSDPIRVSASSNTNGSYQGILFTQGIYNKAAIRAYSTGTTDAGALTFWTSPAGDIPNERMRIDSSGNVGIGTSSPAYEVHVVGPSPDIVSNNTGANLTRIAITTSNTAAYISTTYGGTAIPLIFTTDGIGAAGNEKMRLDSFGNLGIGTSSPARKLDVNGTIRITDGQSIEWGGTTLAIAGTSNTLLFFTSGAERMRLDSSGNLGLGVTPSAWVSGSRALQFGAGGSGYAAISLDTSGGSNVLSNAYESSTGVYTYVASLGASRYLNNFGTHAWYTAPSGTAGNAISFTQAMTLDASGNLGIGTTTTSPYRFNISRSDGQVAFMTDGATADLAVTCVSGVSMVAAATTGVLALGTSGTERARIDSSGNLSVGTSSANAKLDVVGAAGTVGFRSSVGASEINAQLINSSSSGTAIQFYTSGTTFAGSVTTSTTTTAYNTSSDYRLKNITGPLENSGAYIDSLNPVEGTWKADGSTFVGLIAHEVQEASRTNVATGVKDGPEMQAMDYSNAELISNLIAEIKSLRARVAALEAQP